MHGKYSSYALSLKKFDTSTCFGTIIWYPKEQGFGISDLMRLEERNFSCPYCWQMITVQLDLSVTKQTFIEDCQVCCQPIEFTYSVDSGEVVEFSCARSQ